MTDPQLPPPAPYGSIPPVPPAPNNDAAAPAPAPAAPAPPPGTPAPASAHGYQAPPGSYAAPVGGYAAPTGAYQAPVAPAAPKSAVLGIIAFALGIIAAVVAPVLGGVSAYEVGFGLPTVVQYIDSSSSDLSFLSPVRDHVLLGEIGAWSGTIAGVAAIVLGIIAIVKRQGRGWGIAGLILGVIAPIIFFVVLTVMLSIGAGAGAASYYGA